MSNYKKQYGKKPPVIDSTEILDLGKIPYVIIYMPFYFTSYKNIKSSLGTEIKVSNSIKITTIENDKTKGVVLPDSINIDSFVTSQNIVLIASKSSNIRIEINGNEKSIIIPNTTMIIYIRITTNFFSNPKIADGIQLIQNIKFNTDNSGNEGRELELSA